ncbi:hypothetical protein BKA80DRAFT_256270 [Phyllosticta citrichinensis]
MPVFRKPSFFRSNEELLNQFEPVNEPAPVPSDCGSEGEDGQASDSESSHSTLVSGNLPAVSESDVRDPKDAEIEAMRTANKALQEENAALRPLYEENRALRAILHQLRAETEAAKKNEAKHREAKNGSAKKAIKAAKEMQELSAKMAQAAFAVEKATSGLRDV